MRCCRIRWPRGRNRFLLLGRSRGVKGALPNPAVKIFIAAAAHTYFACASAPSRRARMRLANFPQLFVVIDELMGMMARHFGGRTFDNFTNQREARWLPFGRKHRFPHNEKECPMKV